MTRGTAAALGLVVAAFVALSALVATGATGAMDAAALDAAQRLASPLLDDVSSVLTLLGRIEVTSAVALVLALVGYRRAGIRGLVPLLLFAGVAIELALKLVLPHPGPPQELARDLRLFAVPIPEPPYSYPSGHLLRTAFLALLVAPGGWWRAFAWALIGAMAASRVYLAEHWLSDVAGGLLAGVALALLARYSREWRRRP